MGNIFYLDFREFIEILNEIDVKYLLVAGYSVVFHCYSRTTGDIDLWIKRYKVNYEKLKNCFAKFGLAMFDMTKDDFLNHSTFDVYSFGNPPVCIDILVKVKGLDFDECYKGSEMFDDDGSKIRTINNNHLIQSKKSANCPKDIDDINNLTNG
jgi:hypothetical protein